jgi:hypothetical protein
MNMVKKLVLAVSVMLAMTFTFGCSKDDDEKSKEYVFCNTTDSDAGLRMCTEITVGGGFSKSQLEEGACTKKGGVLADKCQDTALKCPLSDKGLDMIIYLYEYPDAIKNCEDFNNLPK